MGIKVAELNTLSDAKGITGIRFFNEMEDTNESTNLRKLADVWMSKNRCCQGHRNRSAVTRKTQPRRRRSKSTSFPEPNLPQNVRFHQTPRSQNHRRTYIYIKYIKSSSESESSVRCCCAAVKTRRNSKECRPKLDENEMICAGYTKIKITRMRRNYL